MFSGIIEEQGTILSLSPNETGLRLRISGKDCLDGCQIGESIAVNGVCLTVVTLGDGYWEADAVEETVKRTNFSDLRQGSVVNLERALRADTRINGHFVQGHVDGTGTIAQKLSNPDGSTLVTISAAPEVLKYIIEKGSIAIDGISMTVTNVTDDSFSVAMIPHTAEVTSLGQAAPGSRVNLEVDMMAKYAERFLSPWQTPNPVLQT